MPSCKTCTVLGTASYQCLVVVRAQYLALPHINVSRLPPPVLSEGEKTGNYFYFFITILIIIVLLIIIIIIFFNTSLIV